MKNAQQGKGIDLLNRFWFRTGIIASVGIQSWTEQVPTLRIIQDFKAANNSNPP